MPCKAQYLRHDAPRSRDAIDEVNGRQEGLLGPLIPEVREAGALQRVNDICEQELLSAVRSRLLERLGNYSTC
jgi:hypothetical protein